MWTKTFEKNEFFEFGEIINAILRLWFIVEGVILEKCRSDIECYIAALKFIEVGKLSFGSAHQGYGNFPRSES